jgi:hypothetical protein
MITSFHLQSVSDVFGLYPPLQNQINMVINKKEEIKNEFN